ncbi:MAG TPA: Do family serine endopeptidase [Bacteroidia bacterium]|jgi:Do/DeqQ family serine protease|nr:Do family serine endopeptidase [Bacteroidia bacterium]
MKRVIGAFLIAAIGGASALGLNSVFNKNQIHADYVPAPQNIKLVHLPYSAPETAIDFRTAAEMSIHTVVHVKTVFESQNTNQMYFSDPRDPFHDFFNGGGFQGGQPQLQQASGSGVIISPDGYIVTNNHVIDHAQKIEVTLNDKRTYEAKVIGKDPSYDLAVLKIEGKNLPYVSYGNSDDVRVGEWVLAVGNPFNLTSTVTAGIVSAKGRNINIIDNDPQAGVNAVESFIQTDAAVNPGNSGGALVNTRGELVGINTAIASQTGSYAGYAFAVPSNLVRKVVSDLIEFGAVQRAYLGVMIRDIDSHLAKEKNISETEGVYVNGVNEGGSAALAGVKEGDVITKVGTVSVNSVPELQEQISRYRPGDKVALTIKRDTKESSLAVVLKNKDNNTRLVEKESVEVTRALGATFETVSGEEKAKLGIENGLKVTKLESGKLRSAGIKEGFIITTIDHKQVNSKEELKSVLENKKGGILIEGIYTNGMRAYYAFGI